MRFMVAKADTDRSILAVVRRNARQNLVGEFLGATGIVLCESLVIIGGIDSSTTICFSGISVVVLVSVIIVAGRSIQTLQDVSTDFQLRSLRKFGDVVQIAGIIDSELNDVRSDAFCTNQSKQAYLHITNNWIIDLSNSHVRVINLADVIWVYSDKAAVSRGPGGYLIHIYSINGEIVIMVHNTYKFTKQIEEAIYKHIPWIYTGYSDEMNTFWSTKRSEMIAAVRGKQKEIGNYSA